jgi:hypothetical protein
MKTILKSLSLAAFVLILGSCEKDEGKLPKITFRTGASYISTDTSLVKGAPFTIGINAEKTEKKDVLKKFNISVSTGGGASTSIFNKDLSGSEGDNFSYDYTAAMDSVSSQNKKYSFTVTNRDGITNTVSLTVTPK